MIQGASLNAELYQHFRRYQIQNKLAKKIIPQKENCDKLFSKYHNQPSSGLLPDQTEFSIPIFSGYHSTNEKYVLPRYEHRKVACIKKEIKDGV